jgi:hypothetical protein
MAPVIDPGTCGSGSPGRDGLGGRLAKKLARVRASFAHVALGWPGRPNVERHETAAFRARRTAARPRYEPLQIERRGNRTPAPITAVICCATPSGALPKHLCDVVVLSAAGSGALTACRRPGGPLPTLYSWSPSRRREASTSRSASVRFAQSLRTRIAKSGSLVMMLSTPRLIIWVIWPASLTVQT